MPGNKCLFVLFDKNMFCAQITDYVELFQDLPAVKILPEEFFIDELPVICESKNIPISDGILLFYYLHKIGQLELLEAKKKKDKRIKARVLKPYQMRVVPGLDGVGSTSIDIDRPMPPYSPSQVLQTLPYTGASYFSRGG